MLSSLLSSQPSAAQPLLQLARALTWLTTAPAQHFPHSPCTDGHHHQALSQHRVHLASSAAAASCPPPWTQPTHIHSAASAASAAAQRGMATRSIPFVDRVRMVAHGGSGGNGCVSFTQVGRGRREVPSGGNGGEGGSVVLRASRGARELRGLPRVVRGGSGSHGRPNRQTGASGETRVVDVPVGMVVSILEDAPEAAQLQDPECTDGADAFQRWRQGGDGHTASSSSSSRSSSSESMQCGEAPVGRGWHARVGQNGEEGSYGYESDEYDEAGDSDEDDIEVEEDEEEEDGEMDDLSDLEFERAEGGGQLDGGMGGEGEEEGGLRARERLPQRQRLLVELLELGQEVTVAVGGQGGTGNASTPSPTRSRSRPPALREPSSESTRGSPGTQATLVLELKMLADVGLVGMPNAGKSSLLRALTGAHAKVGSYAFTTLHPQLGTLVGSDGASHEDTVHTSSKAGAVALHSEHSLVLADIPGLIAGAHEDRGRGNLFLRHIERVGCIAYVLDLSGGQTEGPSPLLSLPPAQQLSVLQEELQAYRASLSAEPEPAPSPRGIERPTTQAGHVGTDAKARPMELVIANKVDACAQPQQALAALKAATALPIIPVSALHSAGLQRLVHALQVAVATARARAS